MNQVKKEGLARGEPRKSAEVIKSGSNGVSESPSDTRAYSSPRELNNRDFCLFSLAKRGGETGFVSTEDVAMTAFQLYPERFSLVRYPEHPDVDVVRVTLVDLRKEKYGAFVEGNKKAGWKLTDAGLAWLRQNASAIERAIKNKHPKECRIESGKLLTKKKIMAQYLKRIYESSAYRKWRLSEKVTLYDFFDIMRVDQYTPEEVYRNHMGQLRDAVHNDPQAVRFLRQLDSEYGRTYREGGR